MGIFLITCYFRKELEMLRASFYNNNLLTLGLALSLLICTSGQSYSQPCPADMSHYWALDDSTAPYGDLCNGADATCTNCPTFTTDSKRDSGAQQFDGINDEVNVADDDSFDWAADASFSIELWMKTSAATGGSNRVLIGRDDPSIGLHWWVGFNASGLVRFALFSNGDGVNLGGIGTALNDGEWHHIAAVRDGAADENRIYVDGTLIDYAPHDYSAGFGSTVALNIGYLNSGSHYRYNGILDEVALWDKALSIEEIEAHYERGLSAGAGYCAGCTDDSECDDGDVCNGIETCDPVEGCQAGTPLVCDDGDVCNGIETCDPVEGCQEGTPLICIDGNICTDDSCNPASGCVYTNNAAPCDDGIFCNGADTCSGGACSVHAGSPCSETECSTCQEETDSCFDPAGPAGSDAGKECTDDLCDGAGVCTHPNNTVPCDDGIACPENDTCTNGQCNGIPNNALCDNGLWCDGAETCDALLGCQDGTPPDCNDNVACTVDSCNEGTDSCDHIPNNALCDNGLWCDGAETCDALLGCQDGTPPDCNDNVACTVDSCNEGTDSCNNIPNHASCDDGVECTINTCHPDLDCQFTPFNPLCYDGEYCTGVEYCTLSGCQSTGNPCTPLACDPGNNRCIDSTITLIVLDAFGSEGTITLVLENLEDEVSQINFELCDPEINDWLTIALGDCLLSDRVPQGQASSCITSDPIPDDGCISVLITAETGYFIELGRGPIAKLNYTIDTAPLFLQNPSFAAEPSPLDEIAHLIPGSTDVRDASNNLLGVTPIPGTVSVECASDEQCNDYNECTTNRCNAGSCVFEPISGIPCDDGLYCTVDDACLNGACIGTARNCDDELFCNGTETCNENSNQCESSGNPCAWLCNEVEDVCLTRPTTTTTTTPPPDCSTDEDCNDDNPCTEDICDMGSCMNPPSEEGTPCTDDELFCNGIEICDGEGSCISTGNPCAEDEICNENDGRCDPATPAPSIVIEPPSWFQSRWIPFIMPLRIRGTNTHFDPFLSTVSFEPVNAVFPFPLRVKDENNISMMVFIMPLWFTKPLAGPVEVTVMSGDEEASGFLEIKLMPFFWEMNQTPLPLLETP